MSDGSWNPWKATAIGLALVVVTAVATGLVVANWAGGSRERPLPAGAPAPASKTPAAAAAHPAASPSTAPTAPAVARPPVAADAPVVPSQAVIAECNRIAAAAPSTKDKTVEVVRDSAVAAVVGAALGAAGGAIADGGKGAGKGAAIGGVVGGGAGALYGLNENRQKDERYRAAYASCMRARGFGG
jgi:hypothetical protein